MPSGSARHHPDRVDRAILQRLQADGRMPNVDLADAVGLSPSACLRRVKSLEAGGIIVGYRAEVSRARAGLNLTVFVAGQLRGNLQCVIDHPGNEGWVERLPGMTAARTSRLRREPRRVGNWR
jgi:DNA-binding Lrp family transcriptional regulator